MSDPTIPLLATYARALVHLKVPVEDQPMALIFAKAFLEHVTQENGRLSFSELKSATLSDLNQQLTKHSEMLMQMLIDPEQGFGIANSKGRPVLIDKD